MQYSKATFSIFYKQELRYIDICEYRIFSFVSGQVISNVILVAMAMFLSSSFVIKMNG